MDAGWPPELLDATAPAAAWSLQAAPPHQGQVQLHGEWQPRGRCEPINSDRALTRDWRVPPRIRPQNKCQVATTTAYTIMHLCPLHVYAQT